MGQQEKAAEHRVVFLQVILIAIRCLGAHRSITHPVVSEAVADLEPCSAYGCSIAFQPTIYDRALLSQPSPFKQRAVFIGEFLMVCGLVPFRRRATMPIIAQALEVGNVGGSRRQIKLVSEI